MLAYRRGADSWNRLQMNTECIAITTLTVIMNYVRQLRAIYVN